MTGYGSRGQSRGGDTADYQRDTVNKVINKGRYCKVARNTRLYMSCIISNIYIQNTSIYRYIDIHAWQPRVHGTVECCNTSVYLRIIQCIYHDTVLHPTKYTSCRPVYHHHPPRTAAESLPAGCAVRPEIGNGVATSPWKQLPQL